MASNFWVIGDTSYSGSAALALENYLRAVPPEVKFIVHVGDIWSGSQTSPALGGYQSVATLLKKSPVPVFIIPGDNEYNDTSNPALALQNWRATFGNFENNWAHGFTVQHQTGRPENFSFVSEGTLYMGFNVVGGRVHSASEWTQRSADNTAWLQAQYAEHGSQVDNIVVFGQAAPSLNSRYDDFEAGLVSMSQSFTGQVLYVQGDKHAWKKDQPYGDSPNFTRIIIDQTDGGSPPLLVRASDDPYHPFSYDHAFSDTPTILGEGVNLVGSSKANTMNGSNANDSIDGKSGNDTLRGNDGNDVLLGGSGKDTLFGGLGADQIIGGSSSDRMTGDAGADTFVFLHQDDSKRDARDVIVDFSAELDTIDLSAVDAHVNVSGNQEFAWMGEAAPTAKNAVTFSYVGGNTIVSMDNNGNSTQNLVIELLGIHALTREDFIL